MQVNLPFTLDCSLSGVQQRCLKAVHGSFKNTLLGTSLMAPWLGIRLPMQGTRVRALVREDPTCRGATKPVRHNY